jgi:hypothetical protein
MRVRAAVDGFKDMMSTDPGTDSLMNLVRVLAVTLCALAVTAPAASAAKKKSDAGPCAPRELATVFEPWKDRALYTLAPRGDFEAGAQGWTLEDGAVVVADSSPFLLGAALGASSLELPAGAVAITPPICVERGFPSFRFVARHVEKGGLNVQVVYPSGKFKRAGRLKPGAEWNVTRKLSLAQGRFRVTKGSSAEIRLRFTASAGTVRIDDVYVDPRYKR